MSTHEVVTMDDLDFSRYVEMSHAFGAALKTTAGSVTAGRTWVWRRRPITRQGRSLRRGNPNPSIPEAYVPRHAHQQNNNSGSKKN